MTDTEFKKLIKEEIHSFKDKNLTKAAISLFQTLGYSTKREAPFDEKTFAYLEENYIDGAIGFKHDKALVADWLSVDLLFQLSKDEIGKKNFSTARVDDKIMESYLFFAVELQKDKYSRTELAQVTREINKIFPMPVMVLFKHGNSLSLSIINRRLNKVNEQKDVLLKVTVIKDIEISTPHRAHVEILFDLSYSELDKKYKFTNFVELHEAWQKTLDLKELNNKFYKELSNWYFWAMGEVSFPGSPIPQNTMAISSEEREKFREHNAKNLIRLLTRILFVWFIKEKKLIPEQIFEEEFLQTELLNDFHQQKETGLFSELCKESRYYKAILQNLFFATLNQTRGKREFRKKDQHYNNTNLMRYESYFKNPNKFLEMVEGIVPFMNGGLFECLDKPSGDKTKKGGDVIDRQDGFTDRDDNKLVVPDYIFFGTERDVDLREVLNSTKKTDKAITVKGLLNILKAYKFTVAENTPIEEEIALDPELLGKVFENLLASYNPETKTTARKQTGSFYTPREIVDYMVDESLKAYLKQKLETEAGIKAEDADTGLEILFAYTEKENVFNKTETNILLRAIDECKILDPACGSGAFPMGILHKLVMVLHKLDPQNKLWKDRQIAKVEELIRQANSLDDDKIKDGVVAELERTKIDIEEAFNNNELDYGRKLFLIESCIYGVDIQPIATQISKLRFFISLIVDQTVNREKDNFGVRPLPNLETKFVTANTLIGIDKPKKGDVINVSLFDNPEIDKLEKKLKDVRHSLFSAKTPDTKRKYRQMDEEIRGKIGDLLIENGWANDTARQLAAWDPYDQNATSPFFDMELMFGISDGFDVVIGNPPYGATVSERDKKYFQEHYQSANSIKGVQKGSLDTFTIFIESGFNVLAINGNLNYIVPLSITSSESMTGLHRLLEANCQTIKVSSYAVRPQPVFENAVVNTSIIFIIRTNSQCERILSTKLYRKNKDFSLERLVQELSFVDVKELKLSGRYPKIGSQIEQAILQKLFRNKTTIGMLIKPDGSPIYYRTTGGRYYKIITNYSTGSTKEKPILLTKNYANCIGAILSSNFFFWFYQIYSNNLDLKSYEVESFPIPVINIDDLIKSEIEAAYSDYLIDVEKNVNIRKTEKYANIDSFKEYKIGKSKHLIDKIDDLICPLYGLTREETDFIKDYEIAFRLSDEEE